MKDKSLKEKNCLIGVVSSDEDLDYFVKHNWYRIPEKAVGNSVSIESINTAKGIALYQTNAITIGLQMGIEYYGEIQEIDFAKKSKYKILDKSKIDGNYYFIKVKKAIRLPNPIISKRSRRITFIRTNLEVLFNSNEINELIIGSIHQEKLFESLKEFDVERNYYMKIGDEIVLVDFAIFAGNNIVGIKTDLESNEKLSNSVNCNFNESKLTRIIRFSPSDIDTDLANCIIKINKALLNL